MTELSNERSQEALAQFEEFLSRNASPAPYTNPVTGDVVLPAEWDCPEDDGLYDDLVPADALGECPPELRPLMGERTVIVAGFAGVGKTAAARALGDCALDLTVAPYKYVVDGEAPGPEEGEALKASYGADCMNPAWPENYAASLLDLRASGRYRFVFIPPESRVLSWLELLGVPYVLAVPRADLADEYRQRYDERGNTERFITIFAGCWDSWMESHAKRKPALSIELGPGEYLLDGMRRVGFRLPA